MRHKIVPYKITISPPKLVYFVFWIVAIYWEWFDGDKVTRYKYKWCLSHKGAISYINALKNKYPKSKIVLIDQA